MVEANKQYIYRYADETKPRNPEYEKLYGMIFFPEHVDEKGATGNFFENKERFEKNSVYVYNARVINTVNLIPILGYKLDKIITE